MILFNLFWFGLVFCIDNEIGEDGCKVIAKSLETNSCLTSLDLYRNEIKDEGCIALAYSLQKNTTLIKLSLIGLINNNNYNNNSAF